MFNTYILFSVKNQPEGKPLKQTSSTGKDQSCVIRNELDHCSCEDIKKNTDLVIHLTFFSILYAKHNGPNISFG